MEHISQIIRGKFQGTKQPLMLRDNQIIKGKITKIYPNNKAEIQIGQHKLVAEVKTPITIGQQYFFQVQDTEQIQLRVLGESLPQIGEKVSVEALLNQLGLKVTKGNVSLLNYLTENKIPFNQQQLEQAFSILRNATNKSEAIELLKTMFIQKLPITNTVFQSLSTFESNQLGKMMTQLHQVLEQLTNLTGQERTLLNQLDTLLNGVKQEQVPTKIIQVLNQSNQRTPLLNILGNLPLLDTEQTTVGKSVQSLGHQLSNQQLSKSISENIGQIIQNGEPLEKTATKIQAIFYHLKTATLSNEQVQQALQMVKAELLSLLPKETANQIWQQLDQAPSNQQLQQMMTKVLDIFSNQQIFQELTQLHAAMTESEENQAFAKLSTQQQFLTHVQNFMELLGVKDEHHLKMNMDQLMHQGQLEQTSTTIKSMLLQMLDNNHAMSDRIQPLLHFINGMQMQSVVDVNGQLQASFMLPGEKLALNEDIYMQFEGKKEEDGKIDKDFCRIFFVLNLENLKETMIDMHIQKKIISVMIYNEMEKPPHFVGLEKILKTGIQALDYQLSNVQWKPLYEHVTKESVMEVNEEEGVKNGIEGFDFRI